MDKLSRAFTGALSVWKTLDRGSLEELRTEVGSLDGNDYLKYLPVVLLDCLVRDGMPEDLHHLVFLLDGNDHYDPDVDHEMAELVGGRLPYSEQESRGRAERVCQKRQAQLTLLDAVQSEAVLRWLEYFRGYAGECACERLCEEAIQYWDKRVPRGADSRPGNAAGDA